MVRLKQAAGWCGGLLLLLIGHRVVLFFLFPFGGGEFHLIFAYSHGGRLDMAIPVLGWSVAIVLVLIGIAAYQRPSIRWPVAATLGTIVVSVHWWQVATYEYATPAFRRVAFALFPLIPSTIFGAIALLEWLRRLRRRFMVARGPA